MLNDKKEWSDEVVSKLKKSIFDSLRYVCWLCHHIRGGRRVIRQTEIAKKMVGKTEIIQKPAAAGSGNWSTANIKFYYLLMFLLSVTFPYRFNSVFLLFSRQNIPLITLIGKFVVYRLSLIANKQEFVKNCHFVGSISEFRK